jgi:uncharacterized protein YjbI with pentapeptide repeats
LLRAVCIQRPTRYRQRAAVRASLIKQAESKEAARSFTNWKAAAVASLISLSACIAAPAFADLNRLEATVEGEFGKGSAMQYGEADIKGKDFSGQDLRRSNFTSADCRDCNFQGANLQGTYFIKAVTARANFKGANLSDSLMDRAVLVDADLTDANLERAIFTRSDFTGAKIHGADFSNALIDKTQQIAMCRYADGVNPETGADTRKSLGCGSRRRFKDSSPSNPDGPQVNEDDKSAFQKTLPVYRQ